MNYKNDWTKSRKRFEALWNNELIDRCAVSVVSPKNNRHYNNQDIPNDELERLNYWTDPEEILKRNLNHFDATYYGGEAFPQIFLNLGAAGHPGLFKNANYRFEDSVWFFPSITNWSTDKIILDKDGFLYKKRLELAQYFVNESRGDFFVSMPDDSGNADVLAHLRGSENLLMDMLTDKKPVHQSLKIIQEGWVDIISQMDQIIRPNNDGGSTIGWMNTWAPGKHGQLQCDLAAMISNDLFNEFIREELIQQSQWYDY